jgi:uncharacterized membrane protein
MKKIFPLILLLSLASVASADSITDINLWIGEDGVTWIEEKVVVEGEGVVNASILVPEFIEDVTVSGPEGRLNHTILTEGKYNRVEFYFKKPLASGESKGVWIKFSTPLLTVKTGSNWVVSYYTPATPRATILRINFPVGSKIISLEPEDILRSYEKYALWLYPQRSEIEFKVIYEYGGIKVPTSIPTTVETNDTQVDNRSRTGFPPFLVLDEKAFMMLIVLLVLILVVLVFLAVRRRGLFEGKNDVGKIEYSPPEEFVTEADVKNGRVSYNISDREAMKSSGGGVKESVIKMLDDKELAIIKLLEKADEEVTQAYIYKTTGIPKTSLSDIIRRIEKRNIIETKKEGRTKWIKLKGWVLE